MKIAASKDLMQEFNGNLDIPEIRVWCHPHYIKEEGDDYFHTFKTFKKAIEFIKSHKGAEEHPLIAINGYELNIFDLEEE